MKVGLFAVLRWLLFLLACFFISILELCFFDDTSIFSLYFALIFPATTIIFSIYYFIKNNTVFFCFYSIALLCALEIANRHPDLYSLLAAMFCMALLFGQSLFHENARKMEEKKPAAASYFWILILVFAVSAAFTYLIFQNGLNRLGEQNRLYVVLNSQPVAGLQVEKPQNNREQEKGTNGSGRQKGGAGTEKPPARWNLKHLAALAALLSLGVLSLFLLRILWRRLARWLWLRKALSLPPEAMVLCLYPYFLWILEREGHGRERQETPYEYLKRMPETGTPILKWQFAEITALFVSVFYGQCTVSKEACKVYEDVCAQLRKNRSEAKREGLWNPQEL